MTRKEVAKIVADKIGEIQSISGREVPMITDLTRPLVDVEGFDSLNDVELTTMLSDNFDLGDRIWICRGPDLQELSLREIVDILVAVQAKNGGV